MIIIFNPDSNSGMHWLNSDWYLMSEYQIIAGSQPDAWIANDWIMTLESRSGVAFKQITFSPVGITKIARGMRLHS